VKVAVSGGAVLAVAGVLAVGVGLVVARNKIGEAAGAVGAAINPANPENIVNKAVSSVAITGGHNGYSYDDHLFAALDLLNPWNDSDIYAEQVWGVRK
jgi:hypothetical protein